MKYFNKYILFLLSIVFVNISCNKILFDNTMPINEQTINKFPKGIQGEYLYLSVDNYSVTGDIYIIERTSNKRLEIYSKHVEFTNNSTTVFDKLSLIDTAWFENGQIHISNGDITKIISVEDTIKSENKKLETVIDLSQEIFYGFFEDTMKCKIVQSNDSYFLNTLNPLGKYNVSRIQFNDTDILITPLSLGNMPGSDLLKEKISNKYNLETIKEHRDKFYIKHYKFNSGEKEFNELVNEFSQLQEIRWSKIGEINSSKNNWFILFAGVGIIFLIFLIKQKR